MAKAKVYDRWHLSRPAKDAEPCTEHSTKARAVMPSVDHGNGKRWQVRYRDPAGEQKKENFDKRTQADARAAEVQNQLDRGRYVDRAAGRETFRTLGERWREGAIHRQRTESNVERALRLHVYPTFGNRAVATIQRSEIQSWVKDRSKVLAPTSLQAPYNALAAILKTAHQDGVITTNPCRGIVLPDVRRPEIVPLHPDAVRALIDATSDRYRALVRLAAASGLRQGELFGLEDHVDIKALTVEVAQQLCGRDKGVPYLGEPKSDQSYRTVPLAPSAVDAVAAHIFAFPPVEVEIEDRTDPRKPKWRKARLLFVSERGGAIRRGSWGKVWARTVKRANKALTAAGSDVRVPEGTTLHDLRHFYASLLIKHGATPKQVQKRLGHAKASITLDVYTHLFEADADETAAVIESVLG